MQSFNYSLFQLLTFQLLDLKLFNYSLFQLSNTLVLNICVELGAPSDSVERGAPAETQPDFRLLDDSAQTIPTELGTTLPKFPGPGISAAVIRFVSSRRGCADPLGYYINWKNQFRIPLSPISTLELSFQYRTVVGV